MMLVFVCVNYSETGVGAKSGHMYLEMVKIYFKIMTILATTIWKHRRRNLNNIGTYHFMTAGPIMEIDFSSNSTVTDSGINFSW